MWPAMVIFMADILGITSGQFPTLPDSLQLSPAELRQEPSFQGRFILADKVSFGCGYGGENVTLGQRWIYILPPEIYWQSHPEYYALVDGQRTDNQVCNSNPAVIEKFARDALDFWPTAPTEVFPMSPNDNDDFCECPSCIESREGGSTTDQVVAFYNAVIKRANEIVEAGETTYPLGAPPPGYSLLAYDGYTEPPLKVKPDPAIYVMIIRIGKYDHRMSEANLRSLIRRWKKLSPHVSISENVGHYKWYGFLPLMPVLARDIKIYKEEGIEIVQAECHPHWMTQGRELWMAQMLLWNSEWSIDYLTERWCKGLYGEAWETMLPFYAILDADAGRFPEGGIKNRSWRILNHRKIAALRSVLKTAARQVKDDEKASYQVALLQMGLEFSQAWAEGLYWAGDWMNSSGASAESVPHNARHFFLKALAIVKRAPEGSFDANLVSWRLQAAVDRWNEQIRR